MKKKIAMTAKIEIQAPLLKERSIAAANRNEIIPNDSLRKRDLVVP
jgi:hypothetical protein